jgi:hypothetical protein
MRVLTLAFCALLLAGCGSSSDDTVDSSGSTAISSNSSHVTLGVNSYLWHASLDTLSFMPLQSADPFGGVIITDWYSAPETPAERLKLTVFRQTQANGAWVDAAVNPDTATKLEDAILTRARELRLASGDSGS